MQDKISSEHELPIVLSEYLDSEEGLLSEEFLVQLIGSYDSDKERERLENAFRRGVRKAWYYGRCFGETWEYKLVFDAANKSNREIATMLQLSETAIGKWFNRQDGVDPENLELFRRYFRDVLENCQPTRHELDLFGFMRAVSEVTRRVDGKLKRLDETDFWRLWFLLRNKLWRDGTARKIEALKSDAAKEINERVHKTLLGLERLRSRRRTTYGPRESKEPNECSVAHLEQLMQSWGRQFAAVVNYLDAVCWSPPHAS